MPDHGILCWTAAGFVAGVIAKFLAGGWNISGCVALIIGGVVGAVTAGWAFTNMLGEDVGTGMDTMAALAGAIALLWVGAVLFPKH